MKTSAILLATLIVSSYLPAASQTRIQARRADAFVDSLGVNVHLESTTPPYNNFAAINRALTSLGMRHIRDEINDTGQTFVSEMQWIGVLGYSLCGLIEGGNDYPPLGTRLQTSQIVPMIRDLRPMIEAVEGPNEPDDSTDPPFEYGPANVRYPLGAIQESQDLWEIVKNQPEIADLPVLAMSEGTASDFNMLATLVANHKIPEPSGYSNFGNMHAYQGGGVGDNGLAEYIRLSTHWTGTERLWTTEMGYHNNTSYLVDGEQQGVSPRAAAIYLPIAFLSGFSTAVQQTFSYELIDESQEPPPNCSGQQTCSGEGYYGLLNHDFSPKPAYTALQDLIALLGDPGSQLFEPGALNIKFSGAPNTMRYTLMQKSNGDYYLAIWNDLSVYQVATCAASEEGTCTQIVLGKNLYPRAVPITISFAEPHQFAVYAPNGSSGVSPTGSFTSSTTSDSIGINLPAEVLVVKIAGK